MDNTKNQVEKVDDTKNNDVNAGQNPSEEINLSEMTPEQLQEFALKNMKAYNDQKARAEKAEKKLKESSETPSPSDDPASKEEPGNNSKGDITPEQVAANATSLDEQYVIARLSDKFSLEEIKEAQSFVGTSFGSKLSDVAANPGFLAHINSKRELSKSDEMTTDNSLHIETFKSKDQFVKEVESGNIDISTDKEARQRYIEIKAKQEADKNFSK